jgi:hypothetical protein
MKKGLEKTIGPYVSTTKSYFMDLAVEIVQDPPTKS